MKSIALLKFSLLSLIVLSPVTLPMHTGSSIFGVFVASSPCDAVSRPLLKIPETANCELVKWHLTLYQDSSTLAPTTYILNYAYGLPEQGTNGLSQGGTIVERKGRWTMVRGTKSNPDAVVYQLDPDRLQESVSFFEVNHNLLHLLDRDENLMKGNAGWSYTLNRTGNFGRPTQPVHPSSTSLAKSSSSIVSVPTIATDPSILGAFVGRSPCRDVARELNKAVDADCIKLKWDLTLYQDPSTLVATTYKLKGTFYRARIGEGRWAIIRGTRTNPDAVIYQLDPDKSQGSLFFLGSHEKVMLIKHEQ